MKRNQKQKYRKRNTLGRQKIDTNILLCLSEGKKWAPKGPSKKEKNFVTLREQSKCLEQK